MTSTVTAEICWAVIFAAFVPFASSAQTTKGEGYASYTMAPSDPKAPQPPSYVGILLGGHGDVDQATRAFCEHSGGGELLVLRASYADEYNAEFHAACPQNTLTTIVITSRDGAKQPFVADKIRSAHAIFIAGGDQSNYVRFWTENPVQEEINRAMARGVPLAGISAGLAVQGEFVFSSMIDTITSSEALADPYGPLVTLTRDFLTIPVLKGVITDSHFSQRERMGRSIVFLSRIVQDGWAATAHGIGVDETTAVIVQSDGRSRVEGKGAAYFMTLDHKPEQCVYGKPLTIRNVKVVKVQSGEASNFDLKSWTSTGAQSFEVNVVDGKMTRSDQ
ncbi:MAG: cyanophycinase [Candidatus Acidiferrales bacterium]